MTGSGDLLMGLRKHSIHKTAAAAVFFPDQKAVSKNSYASSMGEALLAAAC